MSAPSDRAKMIGASLLVAMLIGCRPAAPPTREAGSTAPMADPEVAKTITIGQLNAVKGYAPWDFADTSGGGAVLVEIHVNSLVSQDAQGKPTGRLAARLPSLDDGSVALLPDGRMRVSWALRQGVTWHDGAPFTSDDLVFSWDVLSNPLIPSSGSQGTVVRQVESVEAPDPHTFIMTWRRPFFQALDMGTRNYWPFPKHLLADAFAGDKQAFMAQPYFTSEYVHLGPFRLASFEAGEQQVFRRFDGYYLGRPKLDTIVIRTVRDPSALFANVKAGAINLVGERALPSELFLQLREEWGQTGEGSVVYRQYNWRYLQVQHGLQWAQPIELAQDVRVRRGLLQGIDRQTFEQFLYPGFADTNGDTFLLKDDPRMPVLGRPFARYPYDPAAALRGLETAGWSRTSEGRLLGRDGRQVQIEVRGGNTDAQSVALVADFWRRIGIDVSEVTVAGPTSNDPEYRSTFPGAESTARGAGDQIFPNFDGRLHSLAENRWIGANRMHYANPALDRLVDQLYVTLDQGGQGLILREIGEIFAADLPVLPQYFVMEFAAAQRGVQAIVNDFVSTVGPGTGPGLIARNAHLWDRS